MDFQNLNINTKETEDRQKMESHDSLICAKQTWEGVRFKGVSMTTLEATYESVI